MYLTSIHPEVPTQTNSTKAKGRSEMICKPFSQELHDDNDPQARRKVQDFFLHQQGIEMVENPDKYDIDLLQKDNGDILAGYEVERRHNWFARDFPFTTLHVPARRKVQDFFLHQQGIEMVEKKS